MWGDIPCFAVIGRQIRRVPKITAFGEIETSNARQIYLSHKKNINSKTEQSEAVSIQLKQYLF